MHPYLNVKPTYPPTFLSYNGTRHGGGFWNDPQATMLLFPLAFGLMCMVVLCHFIKLKYFPNTCWVSSHPTEAANRSTRITPARVRSRSTIQQLTRRVDLLTNILIELVQEERIIEPELVQEEIIIDPELEKNIYNEDNNDETKTEISSLDSVEV